MYGATPADRTMPPENADSDETGPSQPGVEHAESAEEEQPEVAAEDVSEGAIEATPAEEHAPSTDRPGTAGTAAIVAGHSTDDSGAAEADDPQAEEGLPADPSSASPSPAVAWEREFPGGPVFDGESAASFRQRWSEIQTEFIDDPRRAVEDADHFVADVVQAFATGVESRRRALTSPWEQDGRTQTEELRLTMRQYRTLVDQILPG